MHRSSLWMIGEEEGTSRVVTPADGATNVVGAVRSGGSSNWSSDVSELLRKRNLKKTRNGWGGGL
jgi:hypothetical protein